jgi:endonuclease YncB( thermonuclease family)
VEFLLVTIFVISFIVMAFRTKRSRRRKYLSRISTPISAPACQPPKPKSVAKAENDQTQRFDSKKSHSLQDKRVLTGTAYVTDGDTITIQNTQIRLYGIDAPELNHPYGQKSKWAMFNLCKGNIIRAEITDEDAYGRTVARCYLPDGRDLSAELVKMGLAIDWPKYSGGHYTAMETADARKKLWLADARQKGRMKVWEKFEAEQSKR